MGPEDRSRSGGRLGGPAVMRGWKPRLPFRCWARWRRRCLCPLGARGSRPRSSAHRPGTR